jgi:hypothetical protein
MDDSALVNIQKQSFEMIQKYIIDSGAAEIDANAFAVEATVSIIQHIELHEQSFLPNYKIADSLRPVKVYFAEAGNLFPELLTMIETELNMTPEAIH